MKVMLEELEELIRVETSKLKNAPFINKAMGLLEIVRAIDDIHCLYSYAIDKKSKEGLEWYKYFKRHNTGFYECYEQLSYDEEKVERTKILYSSSFITKKWANEKLQMSGEIGFVNRFIKLARHGLFEIRKPSAYEFELIYRLESSGSEILETSYQKSYLNGVAQLMLEHPRIKALEPVVILELEKRVMIYDTHFIKYDTTPLIDEYYLLKATAISKSFVGNDTFRDECTFNNISFGDIKKVITWLVANSLKHYEFGQAAMRKYGIKKLNQWDFYSTLYHIEELQTWISSETKVLLNVVEWVVGLLTLTRETLAIHLGAPGSSLPPLIKIEKNWLLRSLAGCLQNPYTYLIRTLKHYYNLDYSIAVNQREEVFKQEFYALFQHQHILKCSQNVVLKKDHNVLTDIDALLYDTKSKTLLLVQLKWMDDFGNSMNQRRSMAKNFQDSIIKWINNTEVWLRENEMVRLLNYFEKIPKDLRIKQVRFLVLGRYFTQFSDYELDDRAIYIAWPQLLHIIAKKNVRNSLPRLIKEIEKGSVKRVNLSKTVPAEKFYIGDYVIEVKFPG